jgi:hypothetical protein
VVVVVVAASPGHQPRTGLAMPDVARRLVERRAPQLVVSDFLIPMIAGNYVSRKRESRSYKHIDPLPLIAGQVVQSCPGDAQVARTSIAGEGL